MEIVYIIWETDNATGEEIFVNVVFNLKAAKKWLKSAIEWWGDRNSYSISKHYRGTDSFGWRQWRKHAVVIHNEVKLF